MLLKSASELAKNLIRDELFISARAVLLRQDVVTWNCFPKYGVLEQSTELRLKVRKDLKPNHFNEIVLDDWNCNFEIFHTDHFF